jgi:dUTP pyrophosphatase
MSDNEPTLYAVPVIELKVKRFVPEAVLPFRATEGSAGYDFTATAVHVDSFNNIVTYNTGIGVAIPNGFVGLMFPRSSVSKTPLSLSNSVGVIDSDYRGEIVFKFRANTTDYSRIYKAGDRIGQLVIVPYLTLPVTEVGEFEETARGTGGFGSTGN